MENKIKVVFGINDFLVGGAQRQLTRQFPLYDQSKFDITLITLFQFPNRQELYHLIPANVRIRKLDFSGFYDIASWIRLISVLNELKPDVVVSSLFFSNTVFRILKICFGYKSIAREHNTYTDKTFLQICIDRLLAKLSYRIVAVSSEVARFTSRQENISPDKFKVICNGIDLNETAKKASAVDTRTIEGLRDRFKIPSDRQIVLNVARLTPQKNHFLLCDGFALFHASHPDYVLVIVGTGALGEKISKYLQEKNYDSFIIMAGQELAVEKYYAAAILFASASDIEGFSNSYLEALAYGLPLVVTKTGGTDELILPGKNGWIIKEKTPESVASALEEADRHVASIPREDVMKTAEIFDIKKTVSEYEKLIMDCQSAK